MKMTPADAPAAIGMILLLFLPGCHDYHVMTLPSSTGLAETVSLVDPLEVEVETELAVWESPVVTRPLVRPFSTQS